MKRIALSVRQRLNRQFVDVVGLFLKLGITAFGGPAAHVAMMHDEVVVRRKWLDDEQFLDLYGATQLIPGPNSTEMAIHLSYQHAGWRGLIFGGMAFILPAMLIVLALAWAYVRFGTTPQVEAILYGVKPVVIVVILQALWVLGRKAVKCALTLGVGLATLGLYFLGISPLVLLLAGGLAVVASLAFQELKKGSATVLLAPLAGVNLSGLAHTTVSLPLLFLTFLKIGAVLYGSGYVLLAFLRTDLVERYGWLTDQQLVDAVAIGQVTPGPVFTTATFIGYVLAGTPGALLATMGIFLPSFIFVALSSPLIPRIRSSNWAGGFLDGVNAAALGLMAAVTVQLGRSTLVDPLTGVIASVTAILLFRFRVNTTWLILGGASVGLVSLALKG